jgi:hypothetical protein
MTYAHEEILNYAKYLQTIGQIAAADMLRQLNEEVNRWHSAYELCHNERLVLLTEAHTTITKLRTALRAYEHGASSIARDALNEGKEV